MEKKASAEKAVREIRRKTRRRFSADSYREFLFREGGAHPPIPAETLSAQSNSRPRPLRPIREKPSRDPNCAAPGWCLYECRARPERDIGCARFRGRQSSTLQGL
jgi:hypothetical protein